jgi:pimeloyl-ACP methyl ester carboxylesterase
VVVALLVVAGGGVFYFAPLRVNDAVLRTRLRLEGVESHETLVEGYRIHYFEAKPRAGAAGGGKALVLLHGLGSRGEDWRGMMSGFADAGFHVYVPDLLGYGRSDKPDVDYAISLEEKLVVDWMQAVGVSRADVGGWSMGGWVALKLTVEHPEMVDRLVLYDSAGVYFPPSWDAALFTPTDAAGLDRLEAMLSPHPQKFPGFVARAVLAVVAKNGWVIQRSLVAMESGKDLMDFQLQNVTRPTLVVWGGVDTLIPPDVGARIQQGIPGASLVVATGCGHLAPSECPKPLLRETVFFLTAEPVWAGRVETVDGSGK